MIEIRGQQATDWQDVYAMRTATPGALPYVRPDWVKDELARPGEGTWPLVAVAQLPDGPQVVARANLQLGRGRRVHCAGLTLEQHPDFGDEASRKLLQEAIEVAEKWLDRHRLEVTLPATDADAIALFESLGFVGEARLRQGVRIAGQLVDEVVLARLSGGVARSTEPAPPPSVPSLERSAPRPQVAPSAGSGPCIRGGSADDWEAYHAIWSQPSVYWGTMQIPYPSADWIRERVQERPPARFWPLVAEIEGQVVGNTGLRRDEHNRSHVGHIGMMVHTDYQGMGVGSALMEAAIDLAENWLGLTRLQLEVYTDNARAIGLYEKYGFEREGLYRAYAYRDGQYVDTLVMGRLGNG
jgi:putative acetyltransferase